MSSEQDKKLTDDHANGEVEPDEQDDSPSSELTKEAELEATQAELLRVRDQLLRTAADFDNFRKRSRREIDDARVRSREELLRDLLPVFDNLERAVAHAEQATDAKAVAAGVQMVLKQFIDTLGRIGIERVEAVGKAFDPNFHDAFQQVETDEHPAGTVVAELQPGYAMGDRLIRAAMVTVAKPPSSDGAASEAKNGE